MSNFDRYSFDINGYAHTFSFCTTEEKRMLATVLASAWRWGKPDNPEPEEEKDIDGHVKFK